MASTRNPDQDEALSATEQGSDTTETRPARTQSFAELSRLAHESRSSWAETMPGHEADKKFMLLIVIAIIVISGITLVGGFREQLFSGLDIFQNEDLDQNSNPVESTPVINNTDKQLLTKVTNLKTRVSELSSEIIELKTIIAELEASKQVSAAAPTKTASSPIQASTITTSQPELEPIEPKPTPKIMTPVVVKPADDTLILAEPITPTPTPTLTASITSAPQASPEAIPEPTPTSSPIASQEQWFINIAAFSDPQSADKLLQKVRAVVASAQIQNIRVNDKALYRIRAFGYASRQTAEADTQRLQSTLGLSGTWINKEK